MFGEVYGGGLASLGLSSLGMSRCSTGEVQRDGLLARCSDSLLARCSVTFRLKSSDQRLRQKAFAKTF